MQMVLAKRAAIAWGRLSAIENGAAQPEPDELTRIAAALQVPIEALLEPLQMMAAKAPRALASWR
jgi:transcriptional regulator with XRE-family HTH domain